jgi:hypothetical protein
MGLVTRSGAVTIGVLLLAILAVFVLDERQKNDVGAFDYSPDSAPISGPAADEAAGLTPVTGAIDCPDVQMGVYTTALGTHRWAAVFSLVKGTDCETARRLVRASWHDEAALPPPRGWKCKVPDSCVSPDGRVAWGRTYRALPSGSSS